MTSLQKSIEERAASILKREEESIAEDAKGKSILVVTVSTIVLVIVALCELVWSHLHGSSFGWADFKWWLGGLFIVYCVEQIDYRFAAMRRLQHERLIRVELLLERVLNNQDDSARNAN